MKNHFSFNVGHLSALVISVFFSFIHAANYNYAEVLQKSIYFYECQQSGPLPSWNRVQWRGPSCLHDGRDVGKDLSGGWFDAGDNLKFNFPMSASVTMLCWGVKEYRDAYVKSGQLTAILNNIRFAAEYLIRCHTAPEEFYGQLGTGDADHKFWGPAESVEAEMPRPAAKIDKVHPGSELAGEAAAALAAVSIVFSDVDTAFASLCLTHARQLYSFADIYRGTYDAAIPDVVNFYRSWSGYADELIWGALWLYMATGDRAYLDKAESNYDNLPLEPQMPYKKFKWTINWDNKAYGCYLLLALLTGKQQYHTDTRQWLDFWTVGFGGAMVRYTPGGLAWLDSWGPNRYSANTALSAFIYSDHVADATLKARYHDFAVRQINYMLGDNPLRRSLVVGFGANPPSHEHHRTATGFYPSHDSDTPACRHTLFGALVGGPGAADDYSDVRNNYTQNEVACDYNAAFVGAVARMYREFGGTPLAQFPPRETPDEQYAVVAGLNITGDRFTEIKAVVQNKTYCPARVCTALSFRYFIDISDALAAGFTLNQIAISVVLKAGNPTVSPLLPYKGSSTIYYLQVSYDHDTLFPGTQDSYKREIQFRLSLPSTAQPGDWDPANDWSYATVGPAGKDLIPATHIPLYDNGTLIWGFEPDGSRPAVRRAVQSPLSTGAAPIIRIRGGTVEISGLEKERISGMNILRADGRTVAYSRAGEGWPVTQGGTGSTLRFCRIGTTEGNQYVLKFLSIR